MGRAEYRAKWILNNPEKHKATQERYNKSPRRLQRARDRHHANKVVAITALGGKCGMCGIAYNGTNGAIFDFHHVDPTQKDSEIGLLLNQLLGDAFFEELSKCEIFCRNCHMQIHSDEF